MKYNYLSLGLLALSASAFGQVGVGTTTPAATLHVAGKPTTASSADGIIPPIISRTNLMAKTGYAASQKGAILYVDDISGTAPVAGSPTEFVNGIGYYYFDGGKWIKLGNPVNVYNTDGSLTSNRIVTQGANTLAFNSTAVNGFSVDGTTLSVDGANNRVGLGTAAPTNALHVTAATNPVKLEGLQADATASNIVMADAAGVLKTIPKTSLASTNIYNTDGSLSANRTVTQGANTLAFTSTATNGFSVDGTTLSVDAANNRIGVGTAAPTNALHVNATTDPVKLSGLQADATAANIVVADATGTLKTLPKATFSTSNIYTADGSLGGNRIITQGNNTLAFTNTAVNGFSVDGTTLSIDGANNRIGVGTAAPTNALHVNATTDPVKLTGLQADATAANIVVADATGTLKTLPKATFSTSNIYTADGSLGGNRIVTQGNNTLAFNSTAVNGFSVDGTTLSVDAANNRIGIGTAAPTNALHVNATADPVKLSGLQADATAANIVVADAAGVLKTIPKTSLASTNIYNTDGSLGGNRIVTQGNNTLAFTSTAVNGFSVDGTTLSIDGANNRIGIGTAAPTNALHVNATADPVKLSGLQADATAANIVVADATGTLKTLPKTTFSTSNIYTANGSLTSPRTVTQGANTLAFTSTATNGFSVDGTTLSVDAANNRVGIGTTTPTTTLDVQGNVRVATMPNQSAGATPVYWNPTSGNLEALTGTQKLFNSYRYTINLTNSDWVSSLDTNIPINNYTVIVTAANFSASADGATNGVGINTSSIESTLPSTTFNSNPSVYKNDIKDLVISDKQVSADKSNGTTWVLKADYPSTGPVVNGSYMWTIDVLVINNSVVKVGTPQTATIPNGGNTASVPMPTDL
ncbi:hypothetical protein SAMN05421786_104159 [Chryseobacterium ureilyticum]|uniref:Uncharacterized protein n=1 Tax=Chryseobacterium ureilyticum TaxID=373668 RepID=A0A1N7NXG0_9FLAO|nr:hypothetical protein [Chryseobacterium ureilyticum]SIT03023.1 hypothetical protein SAMN05421786_104159 [Chryseobacterium ureilyticum]